MTRHEPTMSASLTMPEEAAAVVRFWKAAGPAKWFAKDEAFDQKFRERFLVTHEVAARGALMHWLGATEPALALLLLLDQFPRNAFRGTRRMYATDELARHAAGIAIAAGYDRHVEEPMMKFFYLPFAHSESLADQERCVAEVERLGGYDHERAQHHCDIIRRFGRFPHRNPILGRPMRPEEQAYLDAGGYQG